MLISAYKFYQKPAELEKQMKEHEKQMEKIRKSHADAIHTIHRGALAPLLVAFLLAQCAGQDHRKRAATAL